MKMRGEAWRFWLPVILFLVYAGYTSFRLVRAHLVPTSYTRDYIFKRDLIARRGSIYSAKGRDYPYVRSVHYWEYRMDPVALTNNVFRRKGKAVRTREETVRTISDALKLDYARVLRMAERTSGRGWRDQFLALSSDSAAHDVLTNSKLVSGLKIHDRQQRQYLHGRRLAHVLGNVNGKGCGYAGLELRFNGELSGTKGEIQGMRDALHNELYDKRRISIDPIPGDDLYLTVDPTIQFEAEEALRWGLGEFEAGSGWCIVMDSRTGAILAMTTMPDYEPVNFNRVSDSMRLNRAIGFTFEPGSVMKVITVAAAIDAGFTTPQRVYRTNRDDPDYCMLPGDAHSWEPTMTVKDAVVHSSNIVVGKLGYDFGPFRLYEYLRRFGFGQKTGIELPGEERGILRDPNKVRWDQATRSRVAIGQAVAVTPIQLVSAYQALANDGLRMKPYLVERIVGPDGTEKSRHQPELLGRVVSEQTSRTMREVMLDVASPKGTARRAAIRGYSVAGKTGTAEKTLPGIKGYAPGLYRASFCGIVPASGPRLVILVTLDFDRRTKFHQGGNSAGPVFKRIATAALRYLLIPPDKPDEILDYSGEDEFDRIIDERAEKYDIILQD